jgi:hypothetical protein
MVQAKLPPQNWHYRVACEALAWCCARGTAELADLLQFLDRMSHDLVDQSGASGVATVNVMGHVLPHDSDLISSVLLVSFPTLFTPNKDHLMFLIPFRLTCEEFGVPRISPESPARPSNP